MDKVSLSLIKVAIVSSIECQSNRRAAEICLVYGIDLAELEKVLTVVLTRFYNQFALGSLLSIQFGVRPHPSSSKLLSTSSKRNSDPRPPPVIHIRIPKKPHQAILLSHYPLCEK